jgi:hypothetical protein
MHIKELDEASHNKLHAGQREKFKNFSFPFFGRSLQTKQANDLIFSKVCLFGLPMSAGGEGHNTATQVYKNHKGYQQGGLPQCLCSH